MAFIMMQKERIRKPCASGTFYPGDREDLMAVLRSLDFIPDSEMEHKISPAAMIVPHAGYIYSGRTAMMAFRYLRNTNARTFIIAGPDHYGTTNMVSIQSSGTWETPLGSAKINREVAAGILKNSDNVVEYELAHLSEHSIEVQIPFLQYMFGDNFTFVPLSLGTQTLESMMMLFRALNEINEPYVLISSSDLDHYESDTVVREKDTELIKTVQSLDIDSFYRTLLLRGVSACGYGSIALFMMLARARRLKTRLVHHTTSAETSGDYSSAVGYLSMLAYS